MSAAGRHVLARVRALSARERLLLLLCAAAVAAFVLYGRVVLPATERYRRDRASIPARTAELARFRLAAAGAPRVAAATEEAGRRLAELEKGLLPGKDPAAAGVALQGILKPWVSREDTRLVTVRALPPEPLEEYVEVPVQVELQTTTAGLASILAQVPRNPRTIRVRKLSVTVPGAALYGGGAPRKEVLAVSVVVSGVVRAQAGAAPPKDAAP